MFVPFEAASADLDPSSADGLRKLRPLEIWVLSLIPAWVEFCRTDAIRIAAGYFGSFIANWAR
jgi:hypothetical protein